MITNLLRRFDRNDILIALCIVIFGGVAISFSSYDSLGGFADDGVSYVIMAKAMGFYAQPSEVILEAAKMEKYPPLFPFVLAVTSGAMHYKVAHFIVALSFALSLIVIYLFAKRNSPYPYLALLVTLLFAAGPAPWLNMLGILSENQFLLLSIGALYYFQAHWQAEDLGKNLILAALLTSVVMTRSIGLALLMAYALTLILTQGRKPILMSWLPVLISALSMMLWYLFRDVQGPGLYSSDFYKLLMNLLGQGDKSPWQALHPQIVALYESWYTNLIIYWHHELTLKFIIMSFFALLALLGLFKRVKGRQCDALYVLIYLLVLVVWPYPEQFTRFLYPIVPLLMLYGIVELSVLVDKIRFRHKIILRNLAIVLIAACILPAAAFFPNRALYLDKYRLPMNTIQQFYHPQMDKAIRVAYNHLQLARDMQQLGESVAENESIMWFTPNYINLLAERKAVPIPNILSRLDFEDAVFRSKAEYVYLAKLHPRNTFETFNGLSIADRFREFTSIVWAKKNIYTGEPVSILLRIDREKLQRRLAASH